MPTTGPAMAASTIITKDFATITQPRTNDRRGRGTLVPDQAKRLDALYLTAAMTQILHQSAVRYSNGLSILFYCYLANAQTFDRKFPDKNLTQKVIN